MTKANITEFNAQDIGFTAWQFAKAGQPYVSLFLTLANATNININELNAEDIAKHGLAKRLKDGYKLRTTYIRGDVKQGLGKYMHKWQATSGTDANFILRGLREERQLDSASDILGNDWRAVEDAPCTLGIFRLYQRVVQPSLAKCNMVHNMCRV